MTFAHVADYNNNSSSLSFSLTPAGVGNFILYSVVNTGSNSSVCASMSSTNVTWAKLGTSLAGATNASFCTQVFIGKVTAASAATVTLTWSGATPGAANVNSAGSEFSTTKGFASVTLDKQGSLDSSGTNTWPSLTPGFGAGELYNAYIIDSGSFAFTNGTPAGYAYLDDQSTNNGIGYNVSCPNSATGGIGTDGGSQFGIAVLVYEAAASPAPVPEYPVIPLPPGWFPGADTVITQPGGIPFYAQPGPVIDPGAVIIPPTPQAAGFQAPLYAPGWFPGADAVITQPGGVPFYAQPVPDPGAVPIPPPPPPYPPPYTPEAPGWFPGASAQTAAPDGIPFYVQPMPDSSPPLPQGPTPMVVCQLAGAGGPGWFTDQHGNPKLWVASETPGLPGRAGEWNGGHWAADYDNLFSARSAQGVNIEMVDPHFGGTSSVNVPFVNGNTWDGLSPWANGTDASAGLNPPFWQRIDYMMNSALKYGITIGFDLNIGYDFVTGGPFDSWTNSSFQTYGQTVGARYANQVNLIWLFGNDITPGGYDTYFDSFITGLRSSGANQLIGAWWSSEYTARYYTHTNTAATWGVNNSQFNFTYTYNEGYWVIEYAYAEAASPDNQAHLIPVLVGDGYFFGGGATYDHLQDRAERQEWWWTLTSGARGILAESQNVEHWASAAALAAVTTDWSFVNTLPFVTSYWQTLPQWYNLLPDLSSALVTAGRGTRASGFATGGINYEPAVTSTWVTASKTPDGTLAVLYLPNSTTVTINTALLAPGWTATWVDPVNTATSSAGAGPTYNSTAKGNNSQGDPDWVLVFQAPPLPAAPAPGIPDWLPLPPGWFPGADSVTNLPTGIPFWVNPQPTDQNAPPAAPSVTVNAGLATGTGTAQQPLIAIGANDAAGPAAGTGTAQPPLAAIGANTALATGTGTAQSPLAAVAANDTTGPPAGTGTSQPPLPAVAVSAGLASGTGAALNATVSTVTAALPVPGYPAIPLAPGWFPGADSVTTEPDGVPFYAQPGPADPGASLTAAGNANATLATGTGTAQQPLAAVGANDTAGPAPATGTARSPLAAAGANDATGPPPGTGTSQPPLPAVAVNAGLASGIGIAQPVTTQPLALPPPGPVIQLPPGWFPGADAVATEPGGVPFYAQPGPADPSFTSISGTGPAVLAAGTGTAQQPLAAVAVFAGLASATGTAQAPGASSGANAGLGAGTGAAQGASLAIAANAAAATALAAALNAIGDAVAPFTVGTLTASTAPGATAGGTLTAGTQRTGGPS